MFLKKIIIFTKSEFYTKYAYKIYAVSAGFALLIIVSVVMSASLGAFAEIEDSVRSRRQTFNLINQANSLMSDIVDAETGQRGFLLTNDEVFLEHYYNVRDNIKSSLEELGQFTKIGEAYKHIDAVTPMVSNKLEHLSYNIELRKHESMDIVLQNLSGGGGRLLTDSIRNEFSSYIMIEENALDRDEKKFRTDMSSLFATILTGSLFVILLVLGFVYFFYKETGNRLKNIVHTETKHLLDIQNDINKQLQHTNSALQISEEKLIVTLISIGDGVMATDAEGNVTILNPCAEELTGWTLAEAAGHPADEVFRTINEETREAVEIPVNDTLRLGTKQILTNHTILISRSGSEYTIADSCAPIFDRDGKTVGSVMVFRDVSDRRKIELGLEKTRKELEIIKKTADEASEYSDSIINTVREPLIALDQDLRVVSVSRSFYDFFKVIPEDTVGQLIYDLGNKQWDIPKLRELLETILPQKTTFDNYEVEHDFATIGRRIMLLNARQIERSMGKERIILLAIEDITERKEIEAGLEKTRNELNELATELTRVARVKSEFLANMSHELRTPLNSINGFSEVLFDETFGPLNEKQKKYVNNVLISGRHLLQLINQILDMAKVEAGKMKLSLLLLPMKSLLNEISMLVADLVSKKKLQMSLEIDTGLPDIHADELKVKEIIYNLLSNAVKFTPEGGRIGMKAKKSGSEIQIEVWDTGVGIAHENIEKIFEGFFRVDTPYSRVTEGTGLGLPLSKKFVELHGGKFSIESEGLNKGTRVIFTLPIVSAEALS
jgi:two-component system, cell cycle sensor histidine kinase PleC